jgi:hypothetical protein
MLRRIYIICECMYYKRYVNNIQTSARTCPVYLHITCCWNTYSDTKVVDSVQSVTTKNIIAVATKAHSDTKYFGPFYHL